MEQRFQEDYHSNLENKAVGDRDHHRENHDYQHPYQQPDHPLLAFPSASEHGDDSFVDQQSDQLGPLPSESRFLTPHKPLALGFNPSASQTSLLEAVVGPAPPTQIPSSRLQLRCTPPKSASQSKTPSIDERRVPSEGGRSYGTSTEREWDVLSDASLELNEGEDEEVVEELQKKVNKRRSNLPHLESQLAALEARIKAAEERLARAQSDKEGDKRQAGQAA